MKRDLVFVFVLPITIVLAKKKHSYQVVVFDRSRRVSGALKVPVVFFVTTCTMCKYDTWGRKDTAWFVGFLISFVVWAITFNF